MTATSLFKAVAYGNWQGVLDQLNKGADINTQYIFKRTIQGTYIDNRCHFESTIDEEGRDAGRTIRGEGNHRTGHTILHVACHFDRLDIAQRLIDRKSRHAIDVNTACTDTGVTPLHNAVSPLMAEKLLVYGADINAQTVTGLTPLHVACHYGRSEMVFALLRWKANVNAKSDGGQTPLYQACAKGNLEVVKALIRYGAHVNVTDKRDVSPFHVATHEGNLDVVNYILHLDIENADDKGHTALHMAVIKNHYEVAKLLLTSDLDCDERDDAGLTPLYHACVKGNPEMVELLLDSGANINMKDLCGNTALHYACINGHPKAAALLIENGAKVDIKNKKGKTPCYFASRKGYKELVDLIERKQMNRGRKRFL